MPDPEITGSHTASASKLLVRGLLVLESIAAQTTPVGVGELARQVDLPKSTVQRILGTLDELGWIESTDDPVTRWQLTDRLLTLSRSLPKELDIRQVALPRMRALQAETQESLYLTVPDLQAGTTVLIEKLDSTLPVRAYTAIGSVIPMRASAIGKCVLATLSDDVVDEILQMNTPVAETSTPLDLDELRRQITEIRERGYAVGRGEWRSGICAVAAPVLDEHSRPIAGLVVSMPSFRFSEEIVPSLGARVVEAAQAISRDFQGR